MAGSQAVDVGLAEVGDLRVRVELHLAARTAAALCASRFRSVVLPLPFLPMTAMRSFLPTAKVSPSISFGPSSEKAKDRSSTVMSHLASKGADRNLKSSDLDLFELVELLVPCKRLDARLDRAGLGRLGAEAVDELLHFFALLFVVLARLFVDLFFQQDLVVELLRVAGDLPHLAAVDDHGMGRDAVHELAVVGDDDHLVPPGAQELREPADRDDVEVVRGLVEQQQVRLGHQHLGKVQAHLVAAGQRRGMAVEVIVGEPEAVQDRFGLIGLVDVVFVRRQGEAGLLDHRVLGEMDVLGQMADGVSRRHGDRARVLVLFARGSCGKAWTCRGRSCPRAPRVRAGLR